MQVWSPTDRQQQGRRQQQNQQQQKQQQIEIVKQHCCCCCWIYNPPITKMMIHILLPSLLFLLLFFFFSSDTPPSTIFLDDDIRIDTKNRRLDSFLLYPSSFGIIQVNAYQTTFRYRNHNNNNNNDLRRQQKRRQQEPPNSNSFINDRTLFLQQHNNNYNNNQKRMHLNSNQDQDNDDCEYNKNDFENHNDNNNHNNYEDDTLNTSSSYIDFKKMKYGPNRMQMMSRKQQSQSQQLQQHQQHNIILSSPSTGLPNNILYKTTSQIQQRRRKTTMSSTSSSSSTRLSMVIDWDDSLLRTVGTVVTGIGTGLGIVAYIDGQIRLVQRNNNKKKNDQKKNIDNEKGGSVDVNVPFYARSMEVQQQEEEELAIQRYNNNDNAGGSEIKKEQKVDSILSTINVPTVIASSLLILLGIQIGNIPMSTDMNVNQVNDAATTTTSIIASTTGSTTNSMNNNNVFIEAVKIAASSVAFGAGILAWLGATEDVMAGSSTTTTTPKSSSSSSSRTNRRSRWGQNDNNNDDGNGNNENTDFMSNPSFNTNKKDIVIDTTAVSTTRSINSMNNNLKTTPMMKTTTTTSTSTSSTSSSSSSTGIRTTSSSLSTMSTKNPPPIVVTTPPSTWEDYKSLKAQLEQKLQEEDLKRKLQEKNEQQQPKMAFPQPPPVGMTNNNNNINIRTTIAAEVQVPTVLPPRPPPFPPPPQQQQQQEKANNYQEETTTRFKPTPPPFPPNVVSSKTNENRSFVRETVTSSPVTPRGYENFIDTKSTTTTNTYESTNGSSSNNNNNNNNNKNKETNDFLIDTTSIDIEKNKIWPDTSGSTGSSISSNFLNSLSRSNNNDNNNNNVQPTYDPPKNNIIDNEPIISTTSFSTPSTGSSTDPSIGSSTFMNNPTSRESADQGGESLFGLTKGGNSYLDSLNGQKLEKSFSELYSRIGPTKPPPPTGTDTTTTKSPDNIWEPIFGAGSPTLQNPPPPKNGGIDSSYPYSSSIGGSMSTKPTESVSAAAVPNRYDTKPKTGEKSFDNNIRNIVNPVASSSSSTMFLNETELDIQFPNVILSPPPPTTTTTTETDSNSWNTKQQPIPTNYLESLLTISDTTKEKNGEEVDENIIAWKPVTPPPGSGYLNYLKGPKSIDTKLSNPPQETMMTTTPEQTEMKTYPSTSDTDQLPSNSYQSKVGIDIAPDDRPKSYSPFGTQVKVPPSTSMGGYLNALQRVTEPVVQPTISSPDVHVEKVQTKYEVASANTITPVSDTSTVPKKPSNPFVSYLDMITPPAPPSKVKRSYAPTKKSIKRKSARQGGYLMDLKTAMSLPTSYPTIVERPQRKVSKVLMRPRINMEPSVHAAVLIDNVKEQQPKSVPYQPTFKRPVYSVTTNVNSYLDSINRVSDEQTTSIRTDDSQAVSNSKSSSVFSPYKKTFKIPTGMTSNSYLNNLQGETPTIEEPTNNIRLPSNNELNVEEEGKQTYTSSTSNENSSNSVEARDTVSSKRPYLPSKQSYSNIKNTSMVGSGYLHTIATPSAETVSPTAKEDKLSSMEQATPESTTHLPSSFSPYKKSYKTPTGMSNLGYLSNLQQTGTDDGKVSPRMESNYEEPPTNQQVSYSANDAEDNVNNVSKRSYLPSKRSYKDVKNTGMMTGGYLNTIPTNDRSGSSMETESVAREIDSPSLQQVPSTTFGLSPSVSKSSTSFSPFKKSYTVPMVMSTSGYLNKIETRSSEESTSPVYDEVERGQSIYSKSDPESSTSTSSSSKRSYLPSKRSYKNIQNTGMMGSGYLNTISTSGSTVEFTSSETGAEIPQGTFGGTNSASKSTSSFVPFKKLYGATMGMSPSGYLNNLQSGNSDMSYSSVMESTYEEVVRGPSSSPNSDAETSTTASSKRSFLPSKQSYKIFKSAGMMTGGYLSSIATTDNSGSVMESGSATYDADSSGRPQVPQGTIGVTSSVSTSSSSFSPFKKSFAVTTGVSTSGYLNNLQTGKSEMRESLGMESTYTDVDRGQKTDSTSEQEELVNTMPKRSYLPSKQSYQNVKNAGMMNAGYLNKIASPVSGVERTYTEPSSESYLKPAEQKSFDTPASISKSSSSFSPFKKSYNNPTGMSTSGYLNKIVTGPTNNMETVLDDGNLSYQTKTDGSISPSYLTNNESYNNNNNINGYGTMQDGYVSSSVTTESSFDPPLNVKSLTSPENNLGEIDSTAYDRTSFSPLGKTYKKPTGMASGGYLNGL